MTTVSWTERAEDDLAAIHAFISQDSPRYASVVVHRVIAAVDRLRDFPNSGRVVPEFADASIREIISRPYRIVYRVVNEQEVHVLAVHHGARRFPESL